jgi:hypothetical protein
MIDIWQISNLHRNVIWKYVDIEILCRKVCWTSKGKMKKCDRSILNILVIKGLTFRLVMRSFRAINTYLNVFGIYMYMYILICVNVWIYVYTQIHVLYTVKMKKCDRSILNKLVIKGLTFRLVMRPFRAINTYLNVFGVYMYMYTLICVNLLIYLYIHTRIIYRYTYMYVNI